MAGINSEGLSHPAAPAKDAMGMQWGCLDKPTFQQPRSTPAKPASYGALLLLIINQKSTFQAN
jgi:hypothetical protein